ncbi:hypothetical protein AGMMS49546_04490 [Spirochaetia bacterium]|nr:hypothetical protein AGMMS49546_04490 [Spirochaetia bacterium]
MFPILGLVAAGVASTLTAGEAVVIGASVGAATAIGANALTKKKTGGQNTTTGTNTDDGIDEEEIKAAISIALGILKKSQKE